MEDSDGVVPPDDVDSNCEYTLTHIYITFIFAQLTVRYKAAHISVREKAEESATRESVN